MHRAIRVCTALCLTTLLAACGGATPEAKEPSTESASGAKGDDATPKKDSSDASDTTGGSEGTADEKASDAKASKASGSEEKKSVRSAKDIITREDVLFMFSFSESEPHQLAEKKCEEKSGGDPKKKADCMSKAGKQFDSDGMAFTEDADGNAWWLTIRRKGTGLVTLHKVQIDFDGDSEKQVTIKPHGPDKGTKPGGLPKELLIEVPSESEISVTDPKLGRLVYEAKMGLMGSSKSER